MNNTKSSSNNSVLLFLSGLVAVLLIVLIIFSMNKINSINEQIENETVMLDKNKVTLEKLKQLELLRPEMESANNILIKQIPDKPYEHSIIEYIYNLSEKNKNSFVEIKFEERRQKNDLMELPFKLTINGEYSSILGFLNNISNERLIRVDEIRIESIDNANGLISTYITANAFYK